VTIVSLAKQHCARRVGILFVAVALTGGMVGCLHLGPSRDLEIRTWYDLDAVRHNLAGHHRLMNDLDSTTPGYEELAGQAANRGNGWEPIGTYGYSQFFLPRRTQFAGSFDGQGYEIRDLVVGRPDELQVGLFGNVYEATIENVGVVNAAVTGYRAVGGLVGYSLWGTVTNCYFSGDVIGTENHVGGLVGWNGGAVSDCHASGSVTGTRYVGGLIGLSYGAVGRSHFSGSVTGSQEVGGLVGLSSGAVGRSHSNGGVTGERAVGGLVGANHGTVSNSYSVGSVSGNERIGGLVGNNGAVGRDAAYGSVSKCYASGDVTGTSYVGGLVGSNEQEEGSVSNSFWDVQASGMEESNGGTGKSSVEMMDIATFTDAATEGLDGPWDVVAVFPGASDEDYTWNIVDGQTYPFLSWQSVP